jgi:hypothetical protein
MIFAKNPRASFFRGPLKIITAMAADTYVERVVTWAKKRRGKQVYGREISDITKYAKFYHADKNETNHLLSGYVFTPSHQRYIREGVALWVAAELAVCPWFSCQYVFNSSGQTHDAAELDTDLIPARELQGRPTNQFCCLVVYAKQECVDQLAKRDVRVIGALKRR